MKLDDVTDDKSFLAFLYSMYLGRLANDGEPDDYYAVEISNQLMHAYVRVTILKNHTEVLSPSMMYCNDFVKDCTAIEEELSNLKCANKKLLKSNDFLLKEHEKLTSVNQELRNELKFDEIIYKDFKEIIDEADDLITSHLSKHYQRKWKNFCKSKGMDV